LSIGFYEAFMSLRWHGKNLNSGLMGEVW